MKILIATPSARPALTGNATTADRWATGLRARGHDVTVVATPAAWRRADFERALPDKKGPPADVIHLLHAWKCGRFVEAARARAKRVVVSFAGTDLDPLLDAAHRRVVHHACERAHVLLAAGDDAGPIVARALPDFAARVLSVPKGVRLAAPPSASHFDLRDGSRDLFVVLPAGVRAVKQPRWPLRALERLRAGGLSVRYVVLGPELEAKEAEALAREFADRPWCSRREAPPEAVPGALDDADLVINCSRVEGFSNALAEALMVGSCVLAVDLPGNRAALGSSGILFSDEEDFFTKARALLSDTEMRRRLGEGAKRDARRRFDPDREIDALLRAYENR